MTVTDLVDLVDLVVWGLLDRLPERREGLREVLPDGQPAGRQFRHLAT